MRNHTSIKIYRKYNLYFIYTLCLSKVIESKILYYLKILKLVNFAV